MHELGLCEGVLAVALEAGGGKRVERVRLRIGRLERVVPESMQLAWQLVAQDTAAAGSRLETVEVPLRLGCRSCGLEGEAEDQAICPGCGSTDVAVAAGVGIEVLEVELAGGEIRRNPAFALNEEER